MMCFLNFPHRWAALRNATRVKLISDQPFLSLVVYLITNTKNVFANYINCLSFKIYSKKKFCGRVKQAFVYTCRAAYNVCSQGSLQFMLSHWATFANIYTQTHYNRQKDLQAQEIVLIFKKLLNKNNWNAKPSCQTAFGNSSKGSSFYSLLCLRCHHIHHALAVLCDHQRVQKR